MPSGRQICSASASRSQCISSASSAERLRRIARSARSTVRQSGRVWGGTLGAHVNIGSDSAADSSIALLSMGRLLLCHVALVAHEFSTPWFALHATIRGRRREIAGDARIRARGARQRISAMINRRFSISV
jgi:hypothetical protein